MKLYIIHFFFIPKIFFISLEMRVKIFWNSTYSKLVSSFNVCTEVHLYCLLTIPSKQTVFGSVQQTLPSSVLFFNWHTNQSTALAAILVPRFLSNGVGEPPCCICPERERWIPHIILYIFLIIKKFVMLQFCYHRFN